MSAGRGAQPPDRDDDTIYISGLKKSYGAFPALDGLDLQVTSGEVHAFLGPNGAGKSTTMRVLLGLLRADAGEVRLLGGDPWRDVERLHRRLAYVPGDVSLWPGLTGGQAIDLLGRLRGGLDEQRRDRLIKAFELDPAKRGRQYSKGNRQKVAIVAALASDVELLLLDEPTSGLDPLMEAVFQAEILAEKARGRTVLLSSHILSEAEALADRVSIIRSGRVVETGTLAQLRDRARSSVRATLADPPASIAGWSFAHDAALDGATFTAAVETADLNRTVAALIAHGITGLTVQPPSLEDLFLRHYDRDTDREPDHTTGHGTGHGTGRDNGHGGGAGTEPPGTRS